MNTYLIFFRALFFLTVALAGNDLFAPFYVPEAGHAELKVANRNFIQDPKYAEQRSKLTEKQGPFCVILTCSDSRVPPEIIFNQDLGRIFTVRVAGEVVDDVVLGTIEYAIENFKPSILMVMGHTQCGAVKGVLEHLKRGNESLPSEINHLNAVLAPIETAINEAKIDINAHDALEKSVRAQVNYVAHQLIAQSVIVRKAIEKDKLNIIGAEYNLATGGVIELFIINKAGIELITNGEYSNKEALCC